MHPVVHEKFHELLSGADITHARILEVGGRIDGTSLLIFPELEAAAELYCVNREPLPSDDRIIGITANANRLDMFQDNHFDIVLSNATLEHDKRFWLTAAEMRRVLRPGGTMIVGVPGFVGDAMKSGEAAAMILEHHGPGDYYRLSDEAMREVVFDGFDQVELNVILSPPRIIGIGMKPVQSLHVSKEEGMPNAGDKSLVLRWATG